MGGRGKADRQAPRFAHREDEGVVVGSQQSDEKEEGVKKAPCACRWELLSPLSTPGSCILYMTDSVFDRPNTRRGRTRCLAGQGFFFRNVYLLDKTPHRRTS